MYNIFTENQTSKGFVLKQGVSEDRAKRAFERIISALNSKGATLLSAKTLLVVNELQNIFEEEPLDVLQTIEFKYKKKSPRNKSKKEDEVNIEQLETDEKEDSPCLVG